jgi:hypothetical protein
LRDEFYIKMVIGRLAGEPDPTGMIARQRQAYLQQLREFTALARRTEDANIGLMVEGAILHLQADLRWLDLCDERLERGAQSAADGHQERTGKE